MSWQDDLEIVVSQTKHERYRVLTAESHPDHLAWRARMTERVHGAAATEHPLPAPPANVAGHHRRVQPCCDGFNPMALDP